MKKIINYKGKKIEINMDTYIKYREIGKELDELEIDCILTACNIDINNKNLSQKLEELILDEVEAMKDFVDYIKTNKDGGIFG